MVPLKYHSNQNFGNVKGQCRHKPATQAKQAVKPQKPQAGNPETALIWDLGLIRCVWLCPSASPFLTLVFQCVCNTARVGIKDIRGVFELWNSILNFFPSLCEFLLCDLPGLLCIAGTTGNNLLLKTPSLACIVKATQGLIPQIPVLNPGGPSWLSS